MPTHNSKKRTPKPINTEAISDMTISLIRSLVFLVAVTSYLKHLKKLSPSLKKIIRKIKKKLLAYTINQAVKKIPIAIKSKVN
jgi:hypothetical protein